MTKNTAFVYSKIMNAEKLHLLYTIEQVKTIAGKLWSGEKEKREYVLSMSNFSELRGGQST